MVVPQAGGILCGRWRLDLAEMRLCHHTLRQQNLAPGTLPLFSFPADPVPAGALDLPILAALLVTAGRGA